MTRPCAISIGGCVMPGSRWPTVTSLSTTLSCRTRLPASVRAIMGFFRRCISAIETGAASARTKHVDIAPLGAAARRAGQTSVCRPWRVIYWWGSRRRYELRLHSSVQLDCTGVGILRAERRIPHPEAMNRPGKRKR